MIIIIIIIIDNNEKASSKQHNLFRKFHFESGKIDILKKIQGKFGCTVISTIFLEQENFFDSLSVFMNLWKRWLQRKDRSSYSMRHFTFIN